MRKRINWLATTSLLPFFCATNMAANAAGTAHAPVAAVHADAQHAELVKLHEQLRVVMARLQQLETQAKKPVVVAAAPCTHPAAPCANAAAPAPLAVLQDGSSGISLVNLVTHTKGNCLKVNIGGQANKAVWYANNGGHGTSGLHRSNVQIVDNDNSSTRFWITAEGDLNSDLTFGATIMEEIIQNSTRTTDINSSGTAEVSPTTRKAEVYAVSKSLGELFLGRGHMASYLSMDDPDLSGTKVVMDGTKLNNNGSAVRFFNKSTGKISGGLLGTGTALTVGNVFDACDGLGRKDRVRYNTPSIYGFSAQGSYAYNGSATMYDAGLRYDSKWAGTQVSGAFFWERNNALSVATTALTPYGRTKYNQGNGSIGVLFPVGISVMIAGAIRKYDLDGAHRAKLGFVKLGYQNQFFCVGKTAFAVDYGRYDNFFLNLTKGVSTLAFEYKGNAGSVGVVQYFDKVNTELFLVAHRFKMKVHNTPTTPDKYAPVTVGMLGARVSF